jgi:hypothetical protein
MARHQSWTCVHVQSTPAVFGAVSPGRVPHPVVPAFKNERFIEDIHLTREETAEMSLDKSITGVIVSASAARGAATA